MKKAVVFGAGNIGRSFITPVLQGAGYDVTIVDIDENLVHLLNRKRAYRITLCSREGLKDITISGFTALSMSMVAEITSSLQAADLVSSSVGLKGFKEVCSFIGRILPLRITDTEYRPLDFLLAENIHDAASLCRSTVLENLEPGFPLDSTLGIVETSIGKMVPYLKPEMKRMDPLRLLAEPYNELILDRRGFLNEPPVSADIHLVSPIGAYVDRKLYIHNLGHAATAYLGRYYHPELTMIWEVLEDTNLLRQVRSVMMLSAEMLVKEYPGSYSLQDLKAHVDDLILRFRNQALGDTVQRVGRDLQRKLVWDDRICGVMRLLIKHSLPLGDLPAVYVAAVHFGNHPDADVADHLISQRFLSRGLEWIFDEVSSSPFDDRLLKEVLLTFQDKCIGIIPVRKS